MARNKYDIDEDLQRTFNAAQLRRVLSYVKPYKKQLAITLLLMIVASLSALFGPYIVKTAIDKEIPAGNIKGLMFLAFLFLSTILINAVCTKFRIRFMTDIGQSVIYNIRKDIFVHLQKLPFHYYDSRPHGKILVRVVNYVNALSDLLSNGIINLIIDVFVLIAIIAFMLYLNVKLTMLCFLGLPLLMLAIFSIKNAQRKAWQALSRKQSNLNAYLHESIAGIRVTQSFTREEENLNIFRRLGNEVKEASLRASRISFLLSPAIDNISMMSVILVFLLGVRWLSNDASGISVGVLIAFQGYIGRFWEPITNMGNLYNQLVNASAYLERIFETIDEKPLVDDIPGATEMPDIQGGVEFRNVDFSYEEGHPILKNVSFKVNPGDTIALVGPTGAGKTTIVNLLSRFYDLDDGKVLIDGVDIKGVTLHSLRRQMGVMLQDTFIFSGTIMDNIRYSKLDATDEEVIEAAKAVKAHDFIMAMEDGYYTQVNERGSRLSVGQRQLISFARALLADPKILILDEATSSIDTKTEQALQEGLDRLLKGRTSFIIAHRLSTIKNATRIMYIDKGTILEQGTHDELMKAKGAYWKLYTAQYSFLEAI